MAIRSPFTALAGLLTATDAARPVPAEADPDWSVDTSSLASASDAVWGRFATTWQGPRAGIRHALAREGALRRLRRDPPEGLAVVRLHRLPASPHAGRIRNAVRSLLLGGAAIELSSNPPRARVLDEVITAAAVEPDTIHDFSAARDGSIRCRARIAQQNVLLRAAMTWSGKRPRRSARALETLAKAGIGRVPRSLGDGAVAGADWTLESVEPGGIPADVTGALWQQVVGFAASLPSGGPVTGVADQLAITARLVPAFARPLQRLAALSPPVGLRSIVQHGDLCRDNLLVAGSRLTAVIDWESAVLVGTPGVDLLELFVTERMHQTGVDVVRLWREQCWTDPEFARLTGDYWRAFDLIPDASTLRAVGVAWWINRIATEVQRPERRHHLQDVEWIGRHVAATVAAASSGS